MRDYENLVKKAQYYDSYLNEFIENGIFHSYLMQGFRSINLIEEENVQNILNLISVFTSSYDSIAVILNREAIYLSFKESELKHFVTREYDKIDNFDNRFDAFAAKLVNLYFETKLYEKSFALDHLDDAGEDENEEYDY